MQPRPRDRMPDQRRGSEDVHAVAGPDHVLPCAGRPGRADRFALYAGYTVPPNYDSLIAKLIVHDDDREACLRRLERSLAECVIDGISTTVPLVRALLAEDDIHAARFDTGWLGRFLETWTG